MNFVFGHTYVPEIYEYPFPGKDKELKMLFMNSGSWVVEMNYTHNTFVCIDESGVYLFKWGIGGDVELINAI